MKTIALRLLDPTGANSQQIRFAHNSISNPSPGSMNSYLGYGDGNASSATDSSHAYTNPEHYQTRLVTTKDCSSDTYVTTETTFLSSEANTSVRIDISPNPVHDRANIYIEGGSASKLNLRLSNVPEQVLSEQAIDLYSRGPRTSLDLGHLNPEIYLLEAEGGGIQLTQEIFHVK